MNISITCKNCNGETNLDNSKEFGFCVHCGTKIIIEKNM